MQNIEVVKGLELLVPKERVKSSLIDVVSYAADAGFYYLRPIAVVLPNSEKEVTSLFQFAKSNQIPLVFRAAGTSLSGQSVTDGILVDLSQFWDKITVENEGNLVRVQPGAIGSIVNAQLRKAKRKIGPDPASITSAMMGGILSNNSSGMCCGVSQNSYHTTKYIRFILPDGKAFSTENQADYKRFYTECTVLYEKLKSIRAQIINNPAIFDRIRHKYQTKNTVGYAVNSFVDFEEPLDILAHLLIGAEGTLAFIAEAVLHTIPDFPEKATGMLYFNDIYSACKAISPLKETGAAAVELMDRASLRSIEHMKGMPDLIKHLPEGAAALLTEYQSENKSDLAEQLIRFDGIASDIKLLHPVQFTQVAAEQAILWKVRKGMFPAVGAVRASGTSVILEDIAFPVPRLADAILDLQDLFKKHGYDNAIIFGHAKDGNIHFVVTQGFDTEKEVARYDHFLKDVVNLVVDKYDGALKAEHGTGRNMAPFIEKEWGGEIYEIMKSVKEIVDPDNFLNPGVIINDDKNAHIANLKFLPQVEEEVDRCMECGFCEVQCPSRNVTLTPRKRIVVRRELLNLKNKKDPAYKELLDQYQYQGLDTCAVDGLCATACPVDINTGDLVKRLRRENHSATSNKIALTVAKNFSLVSSTVKFALQSGVFLNRTLGQNTMHNLTKGIKKIVPAFPLWSNQLAVAKKASPRAFAVNPNKTIIYYPSCINRIMGDNVQGEKGVMEHLYSVSAKANINVLLPNDLASSCCGQIFSSKGFKDANQYASQQTVNKLWEVSNHGEYPIVIDVSSCTLTLQHCRYLLDDESKKKFDALTILDSVDYIADLVIPNIKVSNQKDKIVLHPVCSIKKMDGLQQKFNTIANHFSKDVTQPLFAGCCGMAGDRGFLHPELTYGATKLEADEVKKTEFDGYYSSSKTCEIALSDAVGKNYHSILKLVDDCTE